MEVPPDATTEEEILSSSSSVIDDDYLEGESALPEAIVSGIASPSRRKGEKPRNVIFLADFLDGYTWRQFYEMAKLGLTEVPLYLTDGGVTIQRGNGTSTLIIDGQIPKTDLIYYHFNGSLANVPATEGRPACHIANMNVAKLRETIRSVARKEGIRFFQYEGDNFVYVQVYNGNKNAEGCTIVPLEPFQHIVYNLSGFKQSLLEPNCSVSLAEFSGFCTATGKIKAASHVELLVYSEGLVAMSKTSSGAKISDRKWGDCGESIKSPIQIPGGPRIVLHDEGESAVSAKCYTVSVPIDVIKALAKMTNLVNNGIVRVYAERNGLVRLRLNVNYYGTLVIYLRSAGRVSG